MRRLVAATMLALALSGCGTTTATNPEKPASPSASSTASFNFDDVMFAQMMIPHHAQAVEMADLVPTRSKADRVKKLARQIKAAQAPEIKQMRGWLTTWGAPESAEMDHPMPGIVSDSDMAKLKAARGPAFDRLFLKLMIGHHEGAIAMAESEIAYGKDPAAIQLAHAIQGAQQEEISLMKKWLR